MPFYLYGLKRHLQRWSDGQPAETGNTGVKEASDIWAAGRPQNLLQIPSRLLVFLLLQLFLPSLFAHLSGTIHLLGRPDVSGCSVLRQRRYLQANGG